MWWHSGSLPDLLSRGPGFESGISHNDLGVLQDHCVNTKQCTSQGKEKYNIQFRGAQVDTCLLYNKIS